MLKVRYSDFTLEVGCDEAGRGCLAGPVVAAAVILPTSYSHPLLNDSKQLTHKQRELLRVEIEQSAVAHSVAMVSPQEIDRINILNASIRAMHIAIDGLNVTPEYIVVDGNRFKPYKAIPHSCIVKGDSLYLSIAAASILAKTYRDALMAKLSVEYPQYLWEKNKGYPTCEHRHAIEMYGASPHHRRTFRLTNSQLQIPNL
ncbi:MAG: ribonuclease HII [Tenuifilaceae bacterium]|jgi:ribonuclease HII|nr:ribonuclease HII [Tenuifilaceae bacterium]